MSRQEQYDCRRSDLNLILVESRWLQHLKEMDTEFERETNKFGT